PTFKTFVINFSPYFLPAFLVLLIILFAVSVFMSSYITKPLLKLVSIVNMIGKNEYQERVYFDTEDEVGTLLNAINNMYDINLQQMNRIREDEKDHD
ncbi:MAG: HAMP domain-containing protein, partial [Oribacterium sp.]|nr:HAMP domain-containing protein [Oribacterium sp.]